MDTVGSRPNTAISVHTCDVHGVAARSIGSRDAFLEADRASMGVSRVRVHVEVESRFVLHRAERELGAEPLQIPQVVWLALFERDVDLAAWAEHRHSRSKKTY